MQDKEQSEKLREIIETTMPGLTQVAVAAMKVTKKEYTAKAMLIAPRIHFIDVRS